MICPNCGKENTAGSRFCSSCGAKLDATAAESPPADPQTSEEVPKQGFLRKPAGKATLIIIIVAIVVIILIIVFGLRSGRMSEQEDVAPSGRLEAASDMGDDAESEGAVSYVEYDVNQLSEEQENMYAPMETCVYVMMIQNLPYDWDDATYVWSALGNLVNDYPDFFNDNSPGINNGYFWVSEDVLKECASAMFADFDGELPPLWSDDTGNPKMEGNRYGFKVGDRGMDGEGRSIASWIEYSDGTSKVEMQDCDPDDPNVVYATYDITLVRNEYTASMENPLFVYSITNIEETDLGSGSAAGGYILPDSDTRYYTESELSGLSTEELRLARNEIYARHGRMFDSADLQDYFNGLPWYNGTVAASDFSDSMLNEYEKANVKLIQSLEEAAESSSGNSSGTAAGTDAIITSISSGQSYSCDLNGDGIEETISVADNGNQYTGYNDRVLLLVNGNICATIEDAWAGEGYIVDIDTSDDSLQIGLQYSTEDDCTSTAFYGYDSGGVHFLDYILGSFYEPGTYPNISCTGDGTIESYIALSVFETWFASASWMLKGGELVELVPTVYEPLNLFDGEGIDLTVLRSISVTEGSPDNGDRITLPVGTKVHMTGTNNVYWVSMTADGYEGTLYLSLENGYMLFPADSMEMVPVSTVFDNMSIFG